MMVQQKTPGNNVGFTLLEVVVAITIFGLCISLVYVLYNSVTSIVTAVENQAGRDTTAKIILGRLAEDLSGIHMGKRGYVAGTETNGFSREDPVLALTTTAHLRLDPEEPLVDVTLVRYYLREQRDLDTFRLLRSDTPVVTDFESSILPERQLHLLADGVAELTITYIGHDGEEYKEWNSVSDFDEEQDVHKRYPQAYKIVLRLSSGGNAEASARYQTSVPIFAGLYEFAGAQ